MSWRRKAGLMERRGSFRYKLAGGFVLLLIVGATVLALWTRPGTPFRRGTSAERPLEGLAAFGRVPEFSLMERAGKEMKLADLLGKVWIASFIYTHCPDTCPIQSAQMKGLQDEFMGERDLRLVSITVDPRRDTPKVLAEYANRFGADPERWLFLTGQENAIHRLAQEGFRLGAAEIPREKRDASGATHTHSPRLVLVDRKGEIRGYYAGTDQEAMARLRRDLRALLHQAVEKP